MLSQVHTVTRRELESVIMTLVADSADVSVLGFFLLVFVPTSSLDDKLRIRALS